MLSTFVPVIGPIVEKFVTLIPNENDRARAREDLEKQLAEAANAALLAQLEINRVEAAHKSIFVAGWRPAIGWICALAILWAFFLQPFGQFAALIFGFHLDLPKLELNGLWTLILGMLGLGGLRSFEKLKGVARAQ